MEKHQQTSIIIQSILLCFFVYILPHPILGSQILALMYLITFFFLSFFCIKVLIPNSSYDPGHAIVYGITLQISGCLCAQIYKDNENSLLYLIPTFIAVVLLQKLILKNLLARFKKQNLSK